MSNDNPTERRYELHDIRIRVVCSVRLFDRVDEVLRYKGAEEAAEAPGPPHLDLSLIVSENVGSGTEDYVSIGAFGPELETFRKDEHFVIAGPRARAEATPANGKLDGMISPDLLDDAPASRQTLYYVLTYGITVLLRGCGYYGLHAAALARGSEGVLFVGSSDSGKSTLSLTLVRLGWDPVTDDALLLREENEVVQGYSFRRDFCVDPDIVQHFPELGKQDWITSPSDPSKWRVDPSRVYGGHHRPVCVPRVIVFPTIARRSDSRLQEVPAVTAFQLVVRESAIGATPMKDLVERQIGVLGRLLTQSRAYTLDTGTDLFDTPKAVDILLGEALKHATT